jgi:succinate dehydrogenase / fumarate reductase cytochrome b subunit
MPSRARVFDSSIGLKILIGLTGLGLAFYLVIHIVGNLVIFLGRSTFNWYADTLSGNPLIPAIEIGLLLLFALHIYKTIRMYVANRRARPARYAVTKRAGPPSRKTLASTTMIVSGVWLIVFLVIHVRTFRFSAHPLTPDGIVDLWHVEMETFAHPLTVAFYVASMLVVGSHLWHGAASAFQSLGLDHPRWTPRILLGARIFAAAIAGGFIVIALWAHLVGGRL